MKKSLRSLGLLVLAVALLTEHSKGRAVGYALTANACSIVLGLRAIEPVWRFIVTIS